MSADRILLQLQEDLTAKLLSEAALAKVNIVSLRKLLIDSTVDVSMAWLTPRAGKLGTGIVVGMPGFTEELKETGLSDVTVEVPIFCLEYPPSAQSAASGSRLTAPELAVIARRLLRGWVIEGVGSFFTEGQAIQPDAPPPDHDDVVCHVLTVKLRLRQVADTRCARPTISEAALAVTLTNVTSGATIYYTKDGTFPGSGNSAALVYAAPFAVTSGTVVRWAAYKSGVSGSLASQAVIT